MGPGLYKSVLRLVPAVCGSNFLVVFRMNRYADNHFCKSELLYSMAPGLSLDFFEGIAALGVLLRTGTAIPLKIPPLTGS